MAQAKDSALSARLREAVVDQPGFLRDIVQGTLQRLLKEEITLHLNADPHERIEERRGYRNGYRGRQLKTRVGTLSLLVAKGVRSVEQRELLAVDVADSESEATYDALFRKLNERGLHGVQLVTSDDHNGLVAAIQRHFQGAAWQHCHVHFLRNARGKVARKHQAALTADLKAIYAAPDRGWALSSRQRGGVALERLPRGGGRVD